MPRKITVNLYMTLDGYAEFPKYPGSDYAPDEPDQMWKSMWIDRYDSVDTIIYGRRSYEDHVAYHSLSARKPSDPKFLFDFSRFIERCQKIALSHSLTRAEWKNSRIMKGDLARIVARLKKEPGQDIIVDAGPSVTQEFIQRGLVDDYWFLVMPVVLGRGKLYWGSMIRQQTLKLLSGQGAQVRGTRASLRSGQVIAAEIGGIRLPFATYRSESTSRMLTMKKRTNVMLDRSTR